MDSRNLIREAIVLLIRLYQSSLGRFLGGQCRFVPSCSQYAIESVRQFGAVKGIYMAVKRLLRCHPFGSQGFDPPYAKVSEDKSEDKPAKRL
ncbi:MAG: membrane protein insertion efficiency factor YidD [Planctomycetes bacterium]|nr:membrane protein insertion efficiency factor YidD [Planctomycetota bacterium]MBU1517673.1 membrane protein insertion efficiency factor YidD [Planctomycetota bacterium]MBU2458703.1 membrane protein insertion efficiency factor YidD [Planctomycetota bacterium]MBU2596889.1 membrane protein insertion efficiency factor YidD [Planctomycetota bacterium]